MSDIEEMLKLLKKHNVKVADWANGQLYKVEFFPSADELEKRPKAETEADEKVNEATGLTRQQSRDLLGVDE